MQLRELTTQDIDWALPLNQAHVTELSALTAPRFGQLIARAFMAAALDRAAFLLTFDQNAAYDSVNFLWFKSRHERFVYVDRIVVDDCARGQGAARTLYEALFANARAAGHRLIVCEVNCQPPNPVSDAFHAGLGFSEVGTAAIGMEKTVRYLLKHL